MTTDDELCLFCGEPEELSIQDIWVDGNFTLATCCAGFLEHVSAEMHFDPAWSRALLRSLGAEALTGHTLRRVTDGMLNGPVLDHNLQIRDVSFPLARAFIDLHHRHCRAPHGWRYGAAVHNGYAFMGVATVGNPVAPALNGRGIVEVNRLCVRDDLDPMLKWNACSMLYAHSARSRAAGLQPDHHLCARGRGWRKPESRGLDLRRPRRRQWLAQQAASTLQPE